MRIIGKPVAESLVREDGQPVEARFPKHIVRRAEWDKWLDEDQEDIRLIDWGESFRRGEEPAQVALPIDCKAPETILTDRLDYRIDLWTAGIVVGSQSSYRAAHMLTDRQIYHMIFGHRPFGAYDGAAFLVPQMIHFVEDFPTEWKEKWLEIKDEYGKTHDDDTGEFPPFPVPISLCSIYHGNLS